MNALQRILLIVFGLAVGVATTILVMIKGWGLEPQSWWWIIGVSLFGHIFAQIIFQVASNGIDRK